MVICFSLILLFVIPTLTLNVRSASLTVATSVAFPSASMNSIIGSSAGSSAMITVVSRFEASIVALPEPSAFTPSCKTIVSPFSQRSSSITVRPENTVPSIPFVILIGVLSDMVAISAPFVDVLVFLKDIRPATLLSVKVVPVGSNLTFTTVEFAALSSTLYVFEVKIKTGGASSSLMW